jgi:hypothetical protein
MSYGIDAPETKAALEYPSFLAPMKNTGFITQGEEKVNT